MDCPFCKESIPAGEPSSTCPECGAGYHPECWECTGACGACGFAEVEEDEEAPEVDPIARPLPGFDTHDVILGRGFGPTTTQDESAGMVLEEEMGEVLLRLPGHKTSPTLLILVVLFAPLFILAPCLVYALGLKVSRLLPFTTYASFFNAGALVLLSGLLLGIGFVVRTLFETANVTVTERGVFAQRSVSASFVPWSEVEGYRLQTGFVLLECARGQLGLPTVDEERRGQLLKLLDERAVRRLD